MRGIQSVVKKHPSLFGRRQDSETQLRLNCGVDGGVRTGSPFLHLFSITLSPSFGCLFLC